MIGYWHHHVVRLSVRLSVTLRCALWLAGLVVYRDKSCSSVFLADKFLFVRSDTFAVGCILFPQNAPGKKRVEENANVEFFET